MNRYGQNITWGTTAAPHLFSGVCTAYSYRDQFTRQTDDDEAGDYRALILHSAKAALSFEAKISDASTNFLDLSAGAAVTVSGLSTGVILARQAVEHWTLGQPKTASIQATHYPDMTTASSASAGTELSAFTPDQASLGIVTPGGKLIYGTFGLTHTAGVVHELELTQTVQIAEDQPSPAGTILGAASHGYMRTIRLRLLSTGAAPTKGVALTIGGGPDHASGYRIESVNTIFASQRGKMYEINAVWIPPFAS